MLIVDTLKDQLKESSLDYIFLDYIFLILLIKDE